uniref:Septin-type G domain-containing protein n=1 Tax=Tetradesmus obliquus TaxID=3088 RepID=A0A383WEA1_TETOB|eukprot:jgi/Sobl393_1/1395/SZX75036.1
MASIKPRLSMRPITTPVNLLLCGASGSGKSSFIRAFTKMLHADSAAAAAAAAAAEQPATEADDSESWMVSETGASADPHAVLLAGSGGFAAAVGPSHCQRLAGSCSTGCSLDPAGYLEALLSFIFSQQQKDFQQLHGSRGMPKSLVCGSLAHSVTACLYFLPPHGPTQLDLVLMAGLAPHVALLPVVGKADSMTDDEAQDCVRLVRHMLAQPEEYVPGLKPIKLYRSYDSELPFLLNTRSPPIAAPGAAAEAGQAGLHTLLQLLTGDEVYGLLDHAWDNYTTFCSAYEDAGGSSIADLVSAACAAATQAVMPSCAAIDKVSKQLDQKQQEADLLRTALEVIRSKADEWQARHRDAEAAKSKESKFLDELWQVFATYRSKLGYNNYPISQYTGNIFSDELKKRLPQLK